MRHRVTIQEKDDSTAQTASGYEAVVWADKFTAWANVEPMKPRETLAPDGEFAQVDTKITMRARWDVRPKMQAVWLDGGGYTHTYDIHGVQRIGERNRDMLLICRENVGEVNEP